MYNNRYVLLKELCKPYVGSKLHAEFFFLGAIILHLCSKKCDFKVFYSFYKDLECMISAGDPLWKDQLFFDNIFAAVVNACENNEIEDVCKTLKKSIEAKIPVVKDKCLAENDNDRTSDLDANDETFVMRDDFSDFGEESNNKEEPEVVNLKGEFTFFFLFANWMSPH